MVNVRVKFTGGMELLIKDKQPELTFSLPSTATMSSLILHIRDTAVQEDQQSLFCKDNTVRPGILVIINETDWEVEDGPNYVLQDNDEIEFISTLHGG